LRDAYEKNPAMSRDEARNLLERCLKVLFYRDCRALNKVRRQSRRGREEGTEREGGRENHIFFHFQYELAIITADGAEILGPLTQDTNWDIAHYVK
jgi:20S proteasome subunit beta 7